MVVDPGGDQRRPSPYVVFDREAWRVMGTSPGPGPAASAAPAATAELTRLTGLRSRGDPIDAAEIADVYLSLCRLVGLFVSARRRLRASVGDFVHATLPPAPFVIGVAGSVAVGKSTVSRLLRDLLARAPERPAVELVTTDSFLLPNRELTRRGLLDRKGFPESYDRRRLLGFVTAIKGGAGEQTIPVYSHLEYDIVAGERQTVRRPDILILEGLNVLQPPAPGRLAVADLFDLSIYVDGRVADIRRWYLDRFFALRRDLFTDPRSYFHPYARVGEDAAAAFAERMWREVNERNLVANILPTRARATLVLRKRGDHRVGEVWLRRF